MSCYARSAEFSATSPERMYATWQAVHAGDLDRTAHLYDTFSGMPAPSEHDVGALEKADAIKDPDHPLACYAALSDVKENMAKTGCTPM